MNARAPGCLTPEIPRSSLSTGDYRLRGRVIVCIASAWDYDPTSKHQIMRLLARDNKIVWVNYHGTRRPTLGRHDISSAVRALGRVARGPTQTTANILQVTPLVLPGARSRIARLAHRRLLKAQVLRAIRAMDPSRAMPLQIWSFAPDAACLAGALGEERFVYYCVDEYAEFEGFDRRRILAAEADTLACADVVITTSQSLFERRRRRHRNVHLVRHGVDFDHFAAAWRDRLRPPDDVRAIAHPAFGFFGLIHHWIDVRLLADVARLRPQYQFILIGEQKVNVCALREFENVHLLGRRNYDLLPAYCAAFVAALLPFVESTMTRNVNPIKMYEYLAAGLPVVSTRLPEAARFAEAIRFADNADTFAVCCDQVLAQSSTGARARIASLVAGESWAAKVRALERIIVGCPRTDRKQSASRAAVEYDAMIVDNADAHDPAMQSPYGCTAAPLEAACGGA